MKAKAPPMPVNVRAVFADGTVQALDLHYHGFHDGIHEWHVVQTPLMRVGDFRLEADLIPAKTAIKMTLRRLP